MTMDFRALDDQLTQMYRKIQALEQRSGGLDDSQLPPLAASETLVASMRETLESMRKLQGEWQRRNQAFMETHLSVEARLAEERHRIGQDLHDGLSLLAASIMMTRALKQKLEKKGQQEEAKAAGEIADMVQSSIKDIRRLSHGLSADQVAEKDLHKAMEQLMTALQRFPNVKTRVECPQPCAFKDMQRVEHLYRIAQEAAQNAIRHGHASEIVIKVTAPPRPSGHLEMKIIDNGDGFGDKDHTASGEGLGLRLMRHRAQLIDGTLDVRPGESGGTVVTCATPMQ